MVARLNQCIDLLTEANQTVIVLIASLVDIMQLGHMPVHLQLLQQHLPTRPTNVLDRVLSPLITIRPHDPKNHIAADNTSEAIQRVLLLELDFLPRRQHLLVEDLALDVHCYLCFGMFLDVIDPDVDIQSTAVVTVVLEVHF